MSREEREPPRASTATVDPAIVARAAALPRAAAALERTADALRAHPLGAPLDLTTHLDTLRRVSDDLRALAPKVKPAK